jgi:hypothetical protein
MGQNSSVLRRNNAIIEDIMRYLILLLAFTGCATQKPYTTESLITDAKAACAKENTHENQLYCEYGYVLSKCKVENIDLRLCGRLEKDQ